MQNSDGVAPHDVKLQVTFPKSDQDHRLQLVQINGSIFAIFHSPLESNGPINLQCEEWSLVLLSPIKSKADITIAAINVICLNEIDSQEGHVHIEASNRLITFTAATEHSDRRHESGEHGEFQFGEDPTALIKYSQLFFGVVSKSREEGSESFIEAQRKFIRSLCALAVQIEGKPADLSINRVLEVWNIALTTTH